MPKCKICNQIDLKPFIEMAKFNKQQTELKINYICEGCSEFIYNKFLNKLKEVKNNE